VRDGRPVTAAPEVWVERVERLGRALVVLGEEESGDVEEAAAVLDAEESVFEMVLRFGRFEGAAWEVVRVEKRRRERRRVDSCVWTVESLMLRRGRGGGGMSLLTVDSYVSDHVLEFIYRNQYYSRGNDREKQRWRKMVIWRSGVRIPWIAPRASGALH
jgi:hypothetical protein